MTTRRSWKDLSPAERAGIVVGAAVQLALATAAWVDLARRPAPLVRGPKPVWALAIAVNWVGPVAYFSIGRRRAVADA